MQKAVQTILAANDLYVTMSLIQQALPFLRQTCSLLLCGHRWMIANAVDLIVVEPRRLQFLGVERVSMRTWQ